MTAVLTVADLVVTAPGRRPPVLQGVSFSVVRGETLGIVGESGSGKSTLARCLLRLEAPLAIASGRIDVAGEDLAAASRQRLGTLRGRRIGWVPQDPFGAFDPLCSVGAQVRAFVATHREAIAAAAGTGPAGALAATFQRIAAFGVADPVSAARRRPDALSRGMLQRILFAMATATAPDLLVLDEPTAALDAPVADRLVADMARLAENAGTATILITHDLSLAALAAHRILVLKGGTVVETAPTAALIARPASAYTQRLVDSGAW